MFDAAQKMQSAIWDFGPWKRFAEWLVHNWSQCIDPAF